MGIFRYSYLVNHTQRKDHPNRMVFFFASRIVALERVCRFRIAKSAAHSRRRQTHWRLLRRRRRASTHRELFFFFSLQVASSVTATLRRATSLTEGGKRVVFAKHCRAKHTVNFFKRYKSLSGLRYARCARYALWARYTPAVYSFTSALISVRARRGQAD